MSEIAGYRCFTDWKFIQKDTQKFGYRSLPVSSSRLFSNIPSVACGVSRQPCGWHKETRASEMCWTWRNYCMAVTNAREYKTSPTCHQSERDTWWLAAGREMKCPGIYRHLEGNQCRRFVVCSWIFVFRSVWITLYMRRWTVSKIVDQKICKYYVLLCR
jgi:hypothetical protein